MKRAPGGAVLEDRVEDEQQLAHTGHQRYLLRLTAGAQSLVEFLDGRVEARGHQGSHVQNFSHSLSPAPYRCAMSAQRARVAVERSDTHQGRKLLGIKLSTTQTRAAPPEGFSRARDLLYPWHTAQQLLVLAPDGASSDRLVEIVIGARKLFFE